MMVRGTGLGCHFMIGSSDKDVSGFLAEALRHLRPSSSWSGGAATTLHLEWTGGGDLELAVDGSISYCGAPTHALAHAMNVINVAATRHAGSDPVLHCGALAHKGKAVLLPGRPGAGKSTTSTALLLRGLGYLSDEAAPIMADLRVRPYPKPVVIGRGSRRAVAEAAVGVVELPGHELDAWWMDPARWGSSVGAEPLAVGAMLAPQYRSGATLRVEELSRGKATAVMASNTFNMDAHGIAGIERMAALTDGIGLFRVTFGDVDEFCDFVLSDVLE